MAEKLTKRQEQAVNDRGGKLLVSAAAGSGKTKVLVDRLLKYMMDPVKPADVDDFLIITFTKAAAAELRAKIAQKLAEKIAENPENRHLQRQVQRLYLAKISTVHSFCSDLLRENAYRLDIPADFRVGDDNECKQLQELAMSQLLEKVYQDIDTNDDVRQLINTQGLGRDDRQIPKIILKVFHSAECHKNPNEWLDWCLDHMQLEEVKDASETVWGQYLINSLHTCLDGHIPALNECLKRAESNDSMTGPAACLQDTIRQLDGLRRCSTWQQIHEYPQIDFGRLDFGKKCSDMLLADQIKQVRNTCKEDVPKLHGWFADSSNQVMQDLLDSAPPTRGLVALVREFSLIYEGLKRRRRILDYADLEHITLDLLRGKRRDRITDAARELGRRFCEVMVDEYQDTNEVQDAIFEALTSERNNCFMVGDVKQSIYQFRLADPGIFIDKYNHYAGADVAKNNAGRKILLTDNFRSSGGVISAVNDVFALCMSPKVGGLYYTSDEKLYEGISHISLPEPEVELHALVADDDVYGMEASYVAQQIKKLITEEHYFRGKEGLERVKAENIVILLRSPNTVGREYYDALHAVGVSCVMGENEDILQTEEVASLISLLQAINNPLQDIPLVAALSSRIFGFSADDLSRIRKDNKYVSFYEALCKSSEKKAVDFIQLLTELRSDSRIYRLSELIRKIMERTNMFSVYGALNDGLIRCENLQAFYNFVSNFGCGGQRDLTQLLDHIANYEDKGISISADLCAADAVRIMSIHKSKGLEFPIVFLCGLSKRFNLQSAYEQVLCDKKLGLGLNVIDEKQRVRYPNIAKRAISASIIEQTKSEEMRILYVAMTRAKDRLIMTYTKKTMANDLQELGHRIEMTSPEALTADASGIGKWILQAALTRPESGELKNYAGIVAPSKVYDTQWSICLVESFDASAPLTTSSDYVQKPLDNGSIDAMKVSLGYCYPYDLITQIPSKVTATQLKGRSKDLEVAENTRQNSRYGFAFREPNFIAKKVKPTDKGTALHCFMQYADLKKCTDEAGAIAEAINLAARNLMDENQIAILEPGKVVEFVNSELGSLVCGASNVLREFKFSVLVDADEYYPNAECEKILLQGVVDCALIDADGITVIDFKTDKVTDRTLDEVSRGYINQITAYGKALERIYKLPVKKRVLYFFAVGKAVNV